MQIFISHRTDDTPYATALVEDVLIQRFGAKSVFRDVNSIPAGTNYPQMLLDALGRSDVVLVLVGPQWLTIERNGRRMLDNEHDWVRREIKMALDTGKRLIPVLLEGTPMPKVAQLPPDIARFAEQEAVSISAATSRQDAAHLLAELGAGPTVELGADSGTQPGTTEPRPSGGDSYHMETVNAEGSVFGPGGTVHNYGSGKRP